MGGESCPQLSTGAVNNFRGIFHRLSTGRVDGQLANVGGPGYVCSNHPEEACKRGAPP